MELKISNRLQVGQTLLLSSVATFLTMVIFKWLYPAGQCSASNFWAMILVVVFLVMGSITAVGGFYLLYPYFKRPKNSTKKRRK